MPLTHHDDLEFVAGDDWSIDGVLLDVNGASLDLTNATFQWALIDPTGTAVADLANYTTITVCQPPTSGKVVILVPSYVTSPFSAGRFHDALRVTNNYATMYWMGTILVDGDPFSLVSPFVPLVFPLSAQDVGFRHPMIGTPSFQAAFPLLSFDLASGASELDAPAMVRIINFTSSGLFTGAAGFNIPILSKTLSAIGIASNAASFNTPSLVAIDNFTTLGIATGAAVFTLPTFNDIVGLVATGIATGAASFDKPTLLKSLFASNLASGAAGIGTPVISILAVPLTANNLAAGAAALGTPVLIAIPSLSSYAFRWEADDPTTIFQSNAGTTNVASSGDPVGYWGDKSGIGFNITSIANDTTRPTWTISSGIYYVAFDGVNDGLLAAASSGLYVTQSSRETVSIALRGNPAANSYLIADTNSASANSVYCPMKSNNTTATTADPFLRNTVPTTILSEVPTLTNAFNNTDKVITFVDLGSQIMYFVDGVLNTGLGYTRSGSLTLNNFGFGSYYRNAVQSNWWAGRIYNAIATKAIATRDQVRQLAIYQAGKQGRTLTPPTPIFGTNSLYFVPGTYVDVGASNFLYEKTQAWSCMARVRTSILPATASVIATNVTTSAAYPGIDFLWINASGQIHIRLINNISSSFIGVHGTTNVADGNPHTLLATYDGSGVAAGVNLYVDGVLETMTTESNNLSTNLVFNANEHMVVGNQLNHLDFAANGEVALFRLYNVAQNSTFASTYANGQGPTDSGHNCVLAYNFQEGVGTTATDLSPSGLNGTLTTDLIWFV